MRLALHLTFSITLGVAAILAAALLGHAAHQLAVALQVAL